MADSLTLLDAVVARLETAGLTVYAGEPPESPGPLYVCVYGTPGRVSAQRYGATSTDLRWTVSLVCVGADLPGALLVADRVRDALLDVHLTVGRATSPLRETVTGPALTDGPEGDRRTSVTLGYAAHVHLKES